MRAILQYFQNHWYGRHPLQFAVRWSLVLPLFVLLLVHRYLVNDLVARGFLPATKSALALILLYSGLLFWQLVGIARIRARERAAYGSTGDVYVIYALVLIYILFVCVNLVDLTTNANNYDDVPHMADTGLDPLEPAFSLHFLDESATVLAVSGQFGVAATKQLQEFLTTNPHVTTLVFDSQGGNIYEARGVGKLIKDYELSTHVSTECLSACTLAFVNGLRRSADESSRFGFHSYRVDSNFPAVWLDVKEQQRIDRELFADNGVESRFLDKIYSASSDSLWFPSRLELLDSGFLNQK